jgi:hypothetical protein
LFSSLIYALRSKYDSRVVVLIDEYDKPILDKLPEPEAAGLNREKLRNVYGILKGMDAQLHFVFLTGITRFTQASIFSELNNLTDISLLEPYAGVCGFTTEEFDGLFSDRLRELEGDPKFAHLTGPLRDYIFEWYDGYSWDGETRVFNPYSLLKFWSEKKFGSYWFESGTPLFLLNLIKARPEQYIGYENTELYEASLKSYDITALAVVPLLFQTGYLTIGKTGIEGVRQTYTLVTPNLEVREAFHSNLLGALTGNAVPDAATSR